VILPPDAPDGGYLFEPRLTFTLVNGKPKVSAKRHGDDGSGPSPNVLAAEERFDTAIGMDLDVTGTGTSTAAPRMERHTETPLNRSLARPLAMRMPLGLPVDQPGSDFHLGLVGLGK
jgi:hypothetical protein